MKKKNGMTVRVQKGLKFEDLLIRKIDEARNCTEQQDFDMKDHVEVNEKGRVWSF